MVDEKEEPEAKGTETVEKAPTSGDGAGEVEEKAEGLEETGK